MQHEDILPADIHKRPRLVLPTIEFALFVPCDVESPDPGNLLAEPVGSVERKEQHVRSSRVGKVVALTAINAPSGITAHTELGDIQEKGVS